MKNRVFNIELQTFHYNDRKTNSKDEYRYFISILSINA